MARQAAMAAVKSAPSVGALSRPAGLKWTPSPTTEEVGQGLQVSSWCVCVCVIWLDLNTLGSPVSVKSRRHLTGVLVSKKKHLTRSPLGGVVWKCVLHCIASEFCPRDTLVVAETLQLCNALTLSTCLKK